MTGVKLSNLPILTTLNPNDTNILMLAVNENSLYTSVTFSLSTLYSSLYNAISADASIGKEAYNQANLALLTAQTANTFLQANDALIYSFVSNIASQLSSNVFYMVGVNNTQNTWISSNAAFT